MAEIKTGVMGSKNLALFYSDSDHYVIYYFTKITAEAVLQILLMFLPSKYYKIKSRYYFNYNFILFEVRERRSEK